MKYYVDFQHMPAGAARPIDDGEVVGIETDDQGFASIPSVGDYVQIHSDEDHSSFSGRVRTRLFRYFNHRGVKSCGVNIVVEDAPDEIWGELIKE